MKNLYLLFHLSTGDNFTMYPVVLYYQKKYDNIYIYCLYRNYYTVTQLYEKYDNIHIIKIDDPNYNNCVVPEHIFLESINNNLSDSYDVIKTGCTGNNWICTNYFYRTFYSQANLNYDIRYEYNILNRNDIIENQLLLSVKEKYGEKYIFLHDHRNYFYKHYDHRHDVIINSELPIFHPNINYYDNDKDNKYYNYWDKEFYKNNLLDYCKIIENASEIHISDSAFSCLCPYLDLSKVNKKYIYTKFDMEDYHKSYKDWNIVLVQKN